ncbi:MAG: ribosome silencing factor [Saprospiraceae bacterium]|nr:ribosome silencing factor [Saprospiraceae bacterium]
MKSLTREARRAVVSDDQLNDLIIDCIQDIKGKNIVKLDLRALEEAPADYFVICEGDSNTQIRAIGDRIHQRVLEETGLKPYHIEGKEFGRWVLLDYYNTLVHVFHPEARAFYDLEDLWSDARVTAYENL